MVLHLLWSFFPIKCVWIFDWVGYFIYSPYFYRMVHSTRGYHLPFQVKILQTRNIFTVSYMMHHVRNNTKLYLIYKQVVLIKALTGKKAFITTSILCNTFDFTSKRVTYTTQDFISVAINTTKYSNTDISLYIPQP